MPTLKGIVFLAVVALSNSSLVSKDRTIGKVVKLLKGMLDKSVKEGDEETKIYAKFKCYCDQSSAEKKASIKELKPQIELLASNIARVKGDNGDLSSTAAELKAAMADNKKSQGEATIIRDKQNAAFNAEKADLEQAIGQMKAAITTLAKVGADQSRSTGADNKQFLAGFEGLQTSRAEARAASVLSLQAEVKRTLGRATGFMNGEQLKAATEFLQAPFTGTYTSQSAQVMGMIKDMRDTFEKNRLDAIRVEGNDKDDYDFFINLKKNAWTEMSRDYEDKAKQLAANDADLAIDKSSLAKASQQQGEDEKFLSQLMPMCEKKAKGFENRKQLRAAEEAAIAEAVSILNTDSAFATFGDTDAATKGQTGPATLDFIQLRSVHRHLSGNEDARDDAKTVLEAAAKHTHSARLSKVVALLRPSFAFEEVLAEIETMITVIGEEAAADHKKLMWCNEERATKKDTSKTKSGQILSLTKALNGLKADIENPEDGLKKMIEATELSLTQNKDAQTSQTKQREDENAAYTNDVNNLVEAQYILKKAIKVLKSYYDGLEDKLTAGEAFLQEDPKPPEGWKGDGAFKGQSKSGGSAIDMLEFILDETAKEEKSAHDNEEKAVEEYDTSMAKLEGTQGSQETRLAGYQKKNAETDEHALTTQEDLKATIADKEAIEAYLLQIKPGCDFITANFKQREGSRDTETVALKKAVKLIKDTPAYKTAALHR